MAYYYTYKITFVDGCYYYGYRATEAIPKDDIYWGTPKTHKDKWKTMMFFKTIINVFDNHYECSEAELNLIRPVYKTDPLCLNECCGRAVNQTPEIRKKMSEAALKRPKRKMSEEQKIKLRKPKSEEAKRRMSEAQKERTHSPMEGKTHSEETKRKINFNLRKNEIL
jgi:hypothetical protein